MMKVPADIDANNSSPKVRKLLAIVGIMVATGVLIGLGWHLNRGDDNLKSRMEAKMAVSYNPKTHRMKLCRGFVEDAAHDASISRKLRRNGQELLGEEYMYRSRAYMWMYKMCVDLSVSLQTTIAMTNEVVVNVFMARAKANELDIKKFGHDKDAKQIFSDRMMEYSFRAKGARLYTRYLATGKERFYKRALAAMEKGRKYGEYARVNRKEARECRVKLSGMDSSGNLFDLNVSPTARFYSNDGLVRQLRKADVKNAHASCRGWVDTQHKWYAWGSKTLFVRTDNWAMTVKNKGCVVVGLYEPDEQTKEMNPRVQHMVEKHIDVAQDCFSLT